MNKETEALHKYRTWEIVPRPTEKMLLGRNRCIKSSECQIEASNIIKPG